MMETRIWDWEKLDDQFNSTWEYISLIACPFFLFFFLWWDVRKAYKTNSHWVPARVLTLNAFTILLLNQAANVFEDISIAKDVRDVLSFQHVIDSTRLMRCAFMAYIVPEVAQFGFTKTKEYLGTFTILVVSQMVYQMYLLIQNPYKAARNNPDGLTQEGELSKQQVTWFKVSTATTFSALVLFLGLLFTSVASAKTMKTIALSNIKRIKIKKNDPLMDEFFCRLWLTVRSSQTNFLVARSYLISTTSLLTAIVFGIHLIKWFCLRNEDLFQSLDKRYQVAVVMEMAFVFWVWAVVSWRFFTAVYYFPKTNDKNYIGKYLKQSEKDVSTFVEIPLRYIGFTEETVAAFVFILHCILQLYIWAALLCIQVGKMGWILCDIIVGKAARKYFMNEETLVAIQFLKEKECLDDSSHYIRNLQPYSLLGESPYSLWEANYAAFQKVLSQIARGKLQGEDLWIDIQNISSIKTPGECKNDILSQDFIDAWHRSSWDDNNGDGEKLFEESMSWKMELVWLITCILSGLCKNNSKNDEKQKSRDDERVDKAMNVCARMWTMLKLVDGGEMETLAADKEFHRLQAIWKEYKLLNPSDVGHISLSSRNHGYVLLLTNVRRPVEDAFYKMEYGEEGEWDFTDWKKQDVEKYMHNQCVRFAKRVRPTDDLSAPKLLDCMVDQESTLVKFLGWSLQHCISTHLRKGIIQSCRNWSTNLSEPEMFESAIDIGKSQILMERAKTKVFFGISQQ